MKVASIVLLCLSVFFPAVGQQEQIASQVIYNPGQLREDFKLTRQLLETMHPALYDFVPKNKLDKILDSTAMLLDRDMTALDFFRLLSPVISGLGCGHTGVGLPSREAEYIRWFFPLKLKFLNSKAYITGAEGNTADLAGAEVLSINHVSVAEITNELFKHISTDGISKSNRYMYLDNKFDVYYALHIAQPDTFELSVRKSGKPDFIVRLPAATKRANGPGAGLAKPERASPFYMSMPEPRVAVLTIDLFYKEGKKEHHDSTYRAFLDSCFSVLKKEKVKNLVIDLRQNAGGYGTWGAWLYAYLVKEPFHYYADAVAATDQELSFIQYTDWKQDEYREYVKDIVRTPSGGYRWPVHDNLKLQQPQAKSFTGPVYVLIGRKSFSTTAEFCAVAHSNKRATFVGEETGGGYYSINGGDMMEMVLPNTRVKLAIPMRKYLMAVRDYPYKGRGTIPDYTVIPSIEDLSAGIDTEMNFTLELIRKSR